MTRTHRALAALATAAIALLASSCGVDDGDLARDTGRSTEGSTTTTTPDDDLSPMEQAMVDQAAKVYEDLGMDPDDAECLARGIVGGVDSFDPTDARAMMDIVNECDISIGELNELGADNGLNSMEDGIRLGLETSLKGAGLTDAQASCVADAVIEEYGSDPSALQDPAAMRPMLEDCDVDPDVLGD